MKFDKIIGNKEKYKEEVAKLEDRLGLCFAELSLKYEDKNYCAKIGGDIVIYQLVYVHPHIADLRGMELDDFEEELDKKVKNKEITSIEHSLAMKEKATSLGPHILHTAATNGKQFFWQPRFLNKKSDMGLRLVVNHEAWHGLYMHPSRRGSRIPYLWNIAVDYKVNYTIMDDLRLRGFHNYENVFRKELGEYVNLEEYASFLRDPFNPPAKLADWSPIASLKNKLSPGYEKDDKSMFFADAALSDDFKRPENIYDYLINCIPKCNHCGKKPDYNEPEEYKKLKKLVKEMKNDTAKQKP